MNVWIIDHYSSEPQYGGYSRQYDFANGLSKRGINVVVISSAFSHFTHSYFVKDNMNISKINEKAHFIYLKTISYEKNNSIKRMIGSTFSFVFQVIKYSKKIAKIFGKPDIVVGCSMHPFSWIAAQYVANKFKSTFIAEVRDFWPQSWIDENKVSPKNPIALILGSLEKYTFKNASKIIYSLSHGDKYICGVLGFPNSKVEWIGQPMFREKFDKNATRYSEVPENIRNFIDDSFLCVFTGYYKEYEGVFAMLEAAKILKDKPIKFLFLGSGDAKEAMMKYISDNHLNNVLIGDRISKELIPAVLRRAQVCMAQLAHKGLPKSHQYGTSKNKINEYLYSDAVIIYASYVPEDIFEENKIGFTIEPFSGKEFALTIQKIYEMPEDIRKSYGTNARKYIEANTSLEKLTDKYINLLHQSLIEHRNNRSL